MLARQDGRRLPLERRHVVEMVVDRLERARIGVAQHLGEAAVLGFAGEEGDAERLGLAQLPRHFRKHGEAAGDMETADRDRQPGLEERLRQVDGARKLIGLNPHEADEALPALLADQADDLAWPHPAVGFVISVQAKLDIRPERLVSAQLLAQAVEAGERVRGNGGANPLNRIAVIIVMRRLDHDEMENIARLGRFTLGHSSQLSISKVIGFVADPVDP